MRVTDFFDLPAHVVLLCAVLWLLVEVERAQSTGAVADAAKSCSRASLS